MDMFKEIVTRTKIGYIASLFKDQPRVRSMSFSWVEGGNLWSSTYKISGKIQEFLQHEKVEVCFDDPDYRQLRVEGIIDTTGDREKKRKLLEIHSDARHHFKDEDDENLVHIEIVPTRIRWKKSGFREYEEIAIEP